MVPTAHSGQVSPTRHTFPGRSSRGQGPAPGSPVRASGSDLQHRDRSPGPWRAAVSPRNSRASRRNTWESRPVGSSVSLNKHFLRVSLCQAQSWGLFRGRAGSRAVFLTPMHSCPSPQHHPSNRQAAKRHGRITRNAGRRESESTRSGENRQRPSKRDAHIVIRLNGSFPLRRSGVGPKTLRFPPTPRRGCCRSLRTRPAGAQGLPGLPADLTRGGCCGQVGGTHLI